MELISLATLANFMMTVITNDLFYVSFSFFLFFFFSFLNDLLHIFPLTCFNFVYLCCLLFLIHLCFAFHTSTCGIPHLSISYLVNAKPFFYQVLHHIQPT